MQSVQGDYGNKEKQVRMLRAKEFFLKSDPKMLRAWEYSSMPTCKQKKGLILNAFLINRRGNNLPFTLNCQRKLKTLTLRFLSSLQAFCSVCT